MTTKLARGARAATALAAVAMSLGWSVWAAGAGGDFKVRLRPVPIDPATRAAITGSGAASASLDGTTLKLQGSFSGLQSAASAAHLNRGPVRGVRGPKIHDLKVPAASSGDFTAEIKLTRDEADAVRRGQVYLQIDSEKAPEGNLWGWLLE